MTNTYWDSLNKTYHFEKRRDMLYLADCILPYQSLLEHSTGTGALIDILRDKCWTGKYIGTDYADCFLKWAKENNPNEEFCEHDLYEKIDFDDNEFDCVAIHHGLEYVYPYKVALEEAKRVAKKYVFITFWVPFLNGPNQIRFTEKEKWNVNFYNEAEWLNTLAEVGLDIECNVVFHEPDRYNNLFILKVCK